MAIDFPTSPAVDQTYTYSGKVWKWNGSGWALQSNSISTVLYSITTTAVSKTLSDRERCTVTAAGQTITLPASPSAGSEVAVTVISNVNNTVVARNGQLLMGLSEDLTIDRDNTTVTFYFVNATYGWRII